MSKIYRFYIVFITRKIGLAQKSSKIIAKYLCLFGNFFIIKR